MQSTVTIRDYPCGSGKTTSMIEGFCSHRKYLVIVPLLTEVNRVIEWSKSIPFQQPHANDNDASTKTESLESMVVQGQNIATTHSLHERLVPLARRGLLSDYDIIIDEVPEVFRSVSSKSKVSIEEFYLNTGYMTVDTKTGLVRPTNKWWSMRDDVDDTLSTSILTYANTGCLYLLEGHLFIWAMPKELLTAGRTTTILTYKSNGSVLSSYLKKLDVPVEVANDNQLEEAFKRKAAEYILITSAKDGWYKKGNEEVAGPFASGSKLFQGANWVAKVTRGTNDYAHCSHLIYLYDQHKNPYVARWLENNTRSFDDAYALTELIQCVWRSRIRNG